MPDFTVQSDTRLDRFLLRNGVLQWRIPVLIEHGGVAVLEAGTKRSLPLKGPQTRVGAGDVVRVVTPPPKRCTDALQKEANSNCRDYAIVPDATAPDDRKKRKYKPTFNDLFEDYLAARPETILIKNPMMMTLDGFLHGLATSDEIVHPIRNLMVVGHASYSGAFHISIGASASTQAAVTYETLEEAVAKGYLVVDMSLFEPRPTGNGTAQLRLLGCSVGGQAPYMKKLKEALGGKIMVIAPKFLALPDKIRSPAGPIAYFGYDFTVHSPAPAKNRNALLDLYDATSTAAEKAKDPRFTLRGGKRVPPRSWRAWVPADFAKHVFSVLGKKVPKEPAPLSSPVILPGLNTRATARRRFFVNDRAPFFSDPFKGADTKSFPLAKSTGKIEDWKKATRKWLEQPWNHPVLPNKTVKLFDPSHPLPMYVRYGYASMDEFMDGWDWRFKYDDAKKALSLSPVRYEYRVWQPITTEPANQLIMNYYPTGKIPRRFSKVLPVVQLNVNDAYFFGAY